MRSADKERERSSVFICAERKRIVAGLDDVLDKSAFEIEFREDNVYFVAVERHDSSLIIRHHNRFGFGFSKSRNPT